MMSLGNDVARFLVWSSLTVLVGLSACADDSSGDGSEPDASSGDASVSKNVQPQQFCERFGRAIESCDPTIPRGLKCLRIRDASGKDALYVQARRFCNQAIRKFEQAVGASWNAQKATTCLRNIVENPCGYLDRLLLTYPSDQVRRSDPGVLGTLCPEAVVPKQTNGDSCTGNWECKGDDLVCAEMSGSKRTCVSGAAKGEKCSDSWDCQGGLRCLQSGVHETCQPLLEMGEDCGSNEACPKVCRGGTCKKLATKGESCDEQMDVGEHLDCEPPLVCRSGTCREAGTDGDSCEADQECAKRYYCEPEEGVCKRAHAQGESCNPDQFFQCRCGLECISGTCKPE